MGMIPIGSLTVSQEVLDSRAYIAANSARQAELQLIFPLNASGICNATNVESYDFNDASGGDIQGLNQCEAFTTCNNYYSDETNPLAVIRYYGLTSTDECDSGTIEADSSVDVLSSRSIKVEARSL